MGYALMLGPCLVCKQSFSYNPVRVPSFRVDDEGKPDPNGHREPVCLGCMERMNRTRKENGLPPHLIPEDAYEPVAEAELP